MVDVSLYPHLRSGIPDKYICLEEAFKENEIDEIFERFKPFVTEHQIFPIMAGYGNQTICIGSGKENFGQVYYYDFDFGAFCLGCSLSEFCNSLVKSDGKL